MIKACSQDPTRKLPGRGWVAWIWATPRMAWSFQPVSKALVPKPTENSKNNPKIKRIPTSVKSRCLHTSNTKYLFFKFHATKFKAESHSMYKQARKQTLMVFQRNGKAFKMVSRNAAKMLLLPCSHAPMLPRLPPKLPKCFPMVHKWRRQAFQVKIQGSRK